MKRIFLAAVIASFAVGSAFAQESCETKAVGKDGKALAGAAKTSHMKACCEKNAIDKNGNPMKGIVKTQFVDKCVKGT
jgi:hypothetical protein